MLTHLNVFIYKANMYTQVVTEACTESRNNKPHYMKHVAHP